ncbi:hypothetical protein ACFX2J_046724 [Malus domestica]
MELKDTAPIGEKEPEIMLLDNPFARLLLEELRIGDQSLLEVQNLPEKSNVREENGPKEEKALELEENRKLKASESNLLRGTKRKANYMALRITGSWTKSGEKEAMPSSDHFPADAFEVSY